MRRVLFWLHLGTGLAAGIVILIMSATGILLAFQRQILESADRRELTAINKTVAPLPIETLIAAAEKANAGETATAVSVSSDPLAPATVYFGKDKLLFLDPSTGEVLGGGAERLHRFFNSVNEYHRWLAFSGAGKNVGRNITGACNLVFLFLVISGLYLWWPRRWTLNNFKAVLLPSLVSSGKARYWNWHNVAGFWSAPFLLLIVITGVVMSYSWANNALFYITGNQPPVDARPGFAAKGKEQSSSDHQKREGKKKHGEHSNHESADHNSQATADHKVQFDALIREAQKRFESWRTIMLRLPTEPDAPVILSVELKEGPEKRAQMKFNSKTGELSGIESFETYNWGRKLRTWFRFLHTGEIAGSIGQTVAALASLGGIILVVTGFILGIYRFRNRSKAGTDSEINQAEQAVQLPS